MKIALINENSQAAKNGIIEAMICGSWTMTMFTASCKVTG